MIFTFYERKPFSVSLFCFQSFTIYDNNVGGEKIV